MNNNGDPNGLAVKHQPRPWSCTALEAVYCPLCGTCSCPRQFGDRTGNHEECPLHGTGAEHARCAPRLVVGGFEVRQRPVATKFVEAEPAVEVAVRTIAPGLWLGTENRVVKLTRVDKGWYIVDSTGDRLNQWDHPRGLLGSWVQGTPTEARRLHRWPA